MAALSMTSSPTLRPSCPPSVTRDSTTRRMTSHTMSGSRAARTRQLQILSNHVLVRLVLLPSSRCLVPVVFPTNLAPSRHPSQFIRLAPQPPPRLHRPPSPKEMHRALRRHAPPTPLVRRRGSAASSCAGLLPPTATFPGLLQKTGATCALRCAIAPPLQIICAIVSLTRPSGHVVRR